MVARGSGVNLLVWSQYFWPEHFRINELVLALRGQGVTVSVLTGKPNYPAGTIFPGYRAGGLMIEDYEGITVRRIPLWPRGYRSAMGLLLNYLSFVISGVLFAPWLLRGQAVDAILVYAPSPLLQTLPAIFCAWIKRAPLILWVQDIWPEAIESTGFIRNRWLLKGVEGVMRLIYRHCDSILIQSEAFRPSVERLAASPEKIRFYPNAAEDWPEAGPVNSAGTSALAAEMARYFSVVFAGNLGKAQACGTMLKAAERLKSHGDIRFFLIGDGSEAPVLQRIIQERQLDNVIMTGPQPASAMPALLAGSSVLLLSLAGDAALTATIPSKLQTYLTAGKPVLACVTGEAARIVAAADAGLSCPGGDAEALARTVLKLRDLPAERLAEMGANGRAYAKAHFGLGKLTVELIDHIKTLIQSCAK
jgi:glycosyltransferase involved in cell wall biosynthesis